MYERNQKYKVRCVNRDSASRSIQTSYFLMAEERSSEYDGLQLLEYEEAIDLILELRESQIREISTTENVKTETGMTTAGAIICRSQTVSTDGDVSDHEGISDTSLLVGRARPKFNSEDFIRRFSKLTNTLSKQLAGLQETIQLNGRATDLLAGSANNLTAGLDDMGAELSNFNLGSELES